MAVDDPRDADIVWAFDQIDEASRAALGLTAEQYVNQFPFEACIVMKHHLAHTVKQVGLARPRFSLSAYRLRTG